MSTSPIIGNSKKKARQRALFLAEKFKSNPDYACTFDYFQYHTLIDYAPDSVGLYLKSVLSREVSEGQISVCVFSLIDQPRPHNIVRDVVASLVNHTDGANRDTAISTIMGILCHQSQEMLSHHEMVLDIISQSDVQKSGRSRVFNHVLDYLVSNSEGVLKDNNNFDNVYLGTLSVLRTVQKLDLPVKNPGPLAPPPMVKAFMLIEQSGDLQDKPNLARLVAGIMTEFCPDWKEQLEDPRISPQARKIITSHPAAARGLLTDIANTHNLHSPARTPRF